MYAWEDYVWIVKSSINKEKNSVKKREQISLIQKCMFALLFLRFVVAIQ